MSNPDSMGLCGPTALIILDGFGQSETVRGNAVKQASMPWYNAVLAHYPSTLLAAAGSSVGLPEGIAGNSEIGHVIIGAGRVLPSMLTRINESIAQGHFYEHHDIIHYLQSIANCNGRLHLMGLASDAGVHSSIRHFDPLIKMAKASGIHTVFIHAFLDGRDVPPRSAAHYLSEIERMCMAHNLGSIASMHGRFYAMDRDTNWDRTQLSYAALTNETAASVESWETVITESYAQGITDEFIKPVLLTRHGALQSGDGFVCINYRAERIRQLMSALVAPQFSHFTRTHIWHTPESSAYPCALSMSEYSPELTRIGLHALFKPLKIEHTLLDVLAEHHTRVLAIAETEKYAHVTYFFCGESTRSLPTEERILIPSLKEKNYRAHPCMSANDITQTILEKLNAHAFDFYLVNFANADMVGHSGDLAATIAACEYLDTQLSRLYNEVVEKEGGTIILTADHGNAEYKLLPDGSVSTAHTTNPVPFIMIGAQYQGKQIAPGSYSLAHVAATVLWHLGITPPSEMLPRIRIQ